MASGNNPGLTEKLVLGFTYFTFPETPRTPTVCPQASQGLKELGTFLRYIDEQQTDELFQERCQSAHFRLRRLSSIRFPLADKLKLV